jgi:ELWxxDGT repeat protein
LFAAWRRRFYRVAAGIAFGDGRKAQRLAVRVVVLRFGNTLWYGANPARIRARIAAVRRGFPKRRTTARNAAFAAAAARKLRSEATVPLHWPPPLPSCGVQQNPLESGDRRPRDDWGVHMGSIRQWAIALGIALCICRPAGATGVLKDIAPGSGSSYNDLSGFWLPFDGDVVFWTNAGIWRSDGTGPGTVQIEAPFGSLGFTPVGIYGDATDAYVFFPANDSFYGTELWRTDGTPGGKLRLTDLAPGSASANIYYFNASDNHFIFTVDGVLYSTDGSTPASVHTFASGGGNAIVNRGKYYFLCTVNFLNGPCVSDGASAPTLLLQLQANDDFVAVNEKVFFTAMNADGLEPWVTDGTVAGTMMVADIATGSPDSNASNLTRMDDQIYFVARDLTHGYELWTSDGTPAGTKMVADNNAGSGNGASRILGEYDGNLYFIGNNGASGFELFRSDGRAITLVKDIAPGSADGVTTSNGAVINGHAFVGTSVGASGVVATLWASDGSAAGTKVIDPHAGLVTSGTLAAANGKLVFPGVIAGANIGTEPLEINLERVTGHRWCHKPEKTIPDNGAFTDTIKLPEWGGIDSVEVVVDIGHTFAHDLRVHLIGPDNTSVDLIDRPTTTTAVSCSGDLIAVHLADAYTFPVQTKCSNTRAAYPLHSDFKPAQPLSAFAGKSTKGTWQLQVEDLASQDIGTLHEWCVDFTTDRIYFHDFED